MTAAYSRQIDYVKVTAENRAELMKQWGEDGSRNYLSVGCELWGILYQEYDLVRQGQMTRWPSGGGAVWFGETSVWGKWVPAKSLDGHDAEPILATEDGRFYNVYGEQVCHHGWSLRADLERDCGCSMMTAEARAWGIVDYEDYISTFGDEPTESVSGDGGFEAVWIMISDLATGDLTDDLYQRCKRAYLGAFYQTENLS
jgi:hypothetical protein